MGSDPEKKTEKKDPEKKARKEDSSAAEKRITPS
jgi:hypothetical protein